ncbi:MAG: hypothetical protein LBR16_07715 [Treponema sp.]|jgi:hypothetical protein|nr:hypothetical protein [Treponema sp.]
MPIAKRMVILFVGLFLAGFCGYAQEQRPRIVLAAFSALGLSPEEERLAESLIRSYLAAGEERAELTAVYDAVSEGEPQPSPAAQSVSLVVRIYPEEGQFILSLESRSGEVGEAGEVFQSLSAHKSAADLLLAARSLLDTHFAAPERARDTGEPLSEGAIAGSWRGGPGIERVRLWNGKGTVFFSSGALMLVGYTFEDNTLVVRQVSRNNFRYYHPLPIAIAEFLAVEAEPMVWRLRLSGGGKVLRGTRTSTAVQIEDGLLEALLPGTETPEEWIKPGF